MADLTQTAANVGIGSDTEVIRVQVGEAVAQGQPGYRGASNKWYQTDADLSAAAAAAEGVFITPAATDGHSLLAVSGDVNLGATLTVGETYVVSVTKGKICPIGDLNTGDYVTHLGVAKSTSLISLNPQISGVPKP